MPSVSIDESLKNLCPALRLGCLSCSVKVEEPKKDFESEIEKVSKELRSNYIIEALSSHPVNGETRKGYLACGKKPGRYRPSAEALMRRVLQGKGLYRISNVVDMINVVSLASGFSIGGYDMDKIQGDIVLGIGAENEPYQALGRGELNIHRLPTFRDDEGAFGSPTSDSLRTGVSLGTKRFLMIFLDFGNAEKLLEASEFAKELLMNYCSAEEFEWEIVN